MSPIKYRYYKGTRSELEAVKFDITERGKYVTICTVNVYRLTIGIKTHPCENGDNVKLTAEEALEVLKLVQQERNAIKHSRKLKSLEGWRDCGLNLDEYLAVGDEVDEALVKEQRDGVPPRNLKPGYVQVGEPYSDALDPDDEQERYRATYATFHMKRDGERQYWVYAGNCFNGQKINRSKDRDRVQEAIDALMARTEG